MFQFRAFPSYGYWIHRTMTAYCAAVLPHSEISGSTLICSSPKLIAACRVLHRLLMPRHSPCALSSLTCVEENAVFFDAFVKGNLRFFALVLYQELCRLNRIVKQNCIYPFVRENCTSLRPPCGEHPVRSVSSSSQIQTRLRWALDLLRFSTIKV